MQRGYCSSQAPGRNLTIAPLLLAFAAASCSPAQPAPEQLERRLVYSLGGAGPSDRRTELIDVLRRARAHGYNGIVLNDFRVSILPSQGPAYLEEMRRFRAEAEALGMEIIPSAGPFGWSEGMLYNDPNLVEAMPVRDQRLVVRDGAARLEGENLLPNGGFELGDGDQAAGWDLIDRPGIAVRIEESEARTGSRAVLLRDIPRDWRGKIKGRVMSRVDVRPWTPYRASMWVKTEDFSAASAIRLFGAVGRELLNDDELRIERTADWTRYDVLFNSRGHQRIELYAGVWAGGSGRAWIDDIRMEEVAFVNLVRREGAELVVRGADGARYEEGRDFEPLHDSRMGRHTAPGRYDRWHEPPLLRRSVDSRIAEGDELSVDYAHAVTAKNGQATVCLEHPRVYELFEREVRAVIEAYEPRAILLGHDEILAANWCGSCRRPGRTAGALLADNVRRCTEIVRSLDPEIELWFWNDMFDPYHNARKRLALINGDLSGAWTGLPLDATVVNWNRGALRRKSLRFFAGLGLRQIVAGDYDGGEPRIRRQLTAPGARDSIQGVLYATFRRDFSRLQDFADAAWGGAEGPGSKAAGSP